MFAVLVGEVSENWRIKQNQAAEFFFESGLIIGAAGRRFREQ